MSDPNTNLPSETPNVVVADPNTRRVIGNVLYALLFLAGIASLALGIFPELGFGTDIAPRAILFVTSLVTLAGSTFGVTVTRPNIPTK